MSTLGLLVAFLGPMACPPDVGQIRWDGLDHVFEAGGKRFEIKASLWDRDRNGRPSDGDLMRISDVSMSPGGLDVDEAWVVVRGELARALDKRYKQVHSRLKTTCEAELAAQDVPKMASTGALATYLRKIGGDGPPPSKAEQAKSDMAGWVSELCRPGRNLGKEALASQLFERASRVHGAAGRGTLKRLAAEVAEANALECAHLDLPKSLTFE